MPELFRQAVLGMQALSGVELGQAAREPLVISLEAGSLESLLVKFLNELLYLGEERKMAAGEIAVKIAGEKLEAVLELAPITAQTKEIKAVTYHKLAVRQQGETFRVNIIFDV